MSDTTYNGWKNRKTWNVVLWLQNDENLNFLSLRFIHYKDLVEHLAVKYDITKTPDGVRYDDKEIDTYALDEWLMQPE